MLHVLGIAGSLRSGSYNRALLRAAQELAPESMQIDSFDLRSIPLYTADLDDDDRRPAEIVRIKGAIADADAVLIVSPEYNYGLPGVMKNALDWASRPAYRSPLAGKPAGLMGASAGSSGTMRGQEQLKVTLLATAAAVFPHRGVTVARAGQKFDDDLALADEKTREIVADYLSAYGEWIQRLKE